MAISRNGLPRAGRLRSRKIIESIFAKEGTLTFNQYPVLFIYRLHSLKSEVGPCGEALPNITQPDERLQVMFSVPKKKLRKAHDRNLVRRRMREAWRVRKFPLIEQLSNQDLRISVVAVHLPAYITQFVEIEKSMDRFFAYMLNNLAESNKE